MTQRRCARWTPILIVLLLGVVGCSGDDEPTRAPTGEEAPPATDTAGAELDITPVETLATFRRSSAPTGAVATGDVLVIVPTDLAGIWADWGPTASDAPPPPDIPVGATAVVVWDQGKRLTITGLAVDTDGGLVVVGERQGVGEGCGETDDIGGQTIVLSTTDAAVTPGMAVGAPSIEATPGEPC